LSTVLSDGSVVSYVRDVAGRVVERSVSVPGQPTETVRYTFGVDGLHGVLGTSGGLLQTSVVLPGGVTVTATGAGAVWAYPNMHGSIILTADNEGVRIGERTDYDPFGQPIDPFTARIGT